ncbi:MAG: tRNA A-37 threonylcarbamoyl transferase component Bud32 [Hyphomicrobiaceae bacterium]
MRSRTIDNFDLAPGLLLARKYVVGHRLGKGWEGEVYHVTEKATGVERAAKVFFPHRNPGNRALNFYAKKLDRLRDCGIVIQYHNQETFRHSGAEITFLVSDYVEGELLTDFLKRQRGRRLHWFEALHLLSALADGVAEIHDTGEYHGDLHSDNVIVQQRGLGFDVKLIDMFQWGRSNATHRRDDVVDLARLLYDAIGGLRHYSKQPPAIKEICCGLKTSLIHRKFRNAGALRDHLDRLSWE